MDHIYDGERCIYCNVNIYDQPFFGPEQCDDREPIIYTTETPKWKDKADD